MMWLSSFGSNELITEDEWREVLNYMNILIADDENDIRSLIKISLEENGYSVFTAKNGKEAWDILTTQEIHLAILDVMMPVLDGFNLLRKIREHSTIPVIFLTARTDDMDKVLGLGLGADDYLEKPFSIRELVARVGAQLRRCNEYLSIKDESPKCLTYGNLSIDKETCCVYKNGKPIDLNAKEYKLLLYFIEHPERVFTKQQLYRAVWDEDVYIDDNTLMVHISRVRNRIEDDPQKPKYLKTIRGIGYKLHYTGEES
jgi:DNA-binding response OmpR family regulator